MQHFIRCIVACIIITACNSASKEKETEQKAPEVKPVQSCYAYDKGEDLIGLTITVTGNKVSGDLSYVLPDIRTAGTIEGEIRGDTLIGDFTFASGGRLTAREVVFLVQNNALVEGHGDLIEKDGKMVFQDRSRLSFVADRPLKLVPCQK